MDSQKNIICVDTVPLEDELLPSTSSATELSHDLNSYLDGILSELEGKQKAVDEQDELLLKLNKERADALEALEKQTLENAIMKQHCEKLEEMAASLSIIKGSATGGQDATKNCDSQRCIMSIAALNAQITALKDDVKNLTEQLIQQEVKDVAAQHENEAFSAIDHLKEVIQPFGNHFEQLTEIVQVLREECQRTVADNRDYLETTDTVMSTFKKRLADQDDCIGFLEDACVKLQTRLTMNIVRADINSHKQDRFDPHEDVDGVPSTMNLAPEPTVPDIKGILNPKQTNQDINSKRRPKRTVSWCEDVVENELAPSHRIYPLTGGGTCDNGQVRIKSPTIVLTYIPRDAKGVDGHLSDGNGFLTPESESKLSPVVDKRSDEVEEAAMLSWQSPAAAPYGECCDDMFLETGTEALAEVEPEHCRDVNSNEHSTCKTIIPEAQQGAKFDATALPLSAAAPPLSQTMESIYDMFYS